MKRTKEVKETRSTGVCGAVIQWNFFLFDDYNVIDSRPDAGH